jgi:hypothetical protein
MQPGCQNGTSRAGVVISGPLASINLNNNGLSVFRRARAIRSQFETRRGARLKVTLVLI